MADAVQRREVVEHIAQRPHAVLLVGLGQGAERRVDHPADHARAPGGVDRRFDAARRRRAAPGG